MSSVESQHIGYVLKMYPRLSETFIVNEILAHEAAGLKVSIFSLRSPVEGRFHAALSRVRAKVHYVPYERMNANEFWNAACAAADRLPGGGELFDLARHERASAVAQAILLAGMVHECGLTHLHAHFATVSTTVARLAGRLADVPYSFTAHAKDIYHESVDEEDLRRKIRDAAGVITVSDFNTADLARRFGSDSSTVRRVYNGLDLDEFSYDYRADDSAIIVAVGRLIEKKGFGDLIDACAILRDRGRDVKCRIVGGGLLHDQLAEQISALHLDDRVQLLGSRPQHEVVEHLRQATLAAVPCVIGRDGNRDGLPTVLLEAMAVGTPCISTDVTGIPEVVLDEETGLVTKPGDPIELADAITRLLDDEPLRERLAGSARSLMETQFDIHRNTAGAREFFSSCRNGAACP